MVVSSLLMILSSQCSTQRVISSLRILNSAGIYILLGAEFISFKITVIVYIGAVVFIFVCGDDNGNKLAVSIRSLKDINLF